MLISTSIDETAGRLFGDPLRAEIVRRLAVEQLCTCHLVEMTGARQPTVSHHLKLLRDADLVEATACRRSTGSCRCGSAVAMAAGLLLGRLVPGLDETLDRVKIDTVSLPIAVGLL
jgi:ArsR family transcriptional regulator, arsenate/arsenite/antimonite-responsive transcriptional repressor